MKNKKIDTHTGSLAWYREMETKLLQGQVERAEMRRSARWPIKAMQMMRHELLTLRIAMGLRRTLFAGNFERIVVKEIVPSANAKGLCQG